MTSTSIRISLQGLIERYQLCAARVTYLTEKERDTHEFWAIKKEEQSIFKKVLDGLYTLKSGGLTEHCASALKQGDIIKLSDLAFELLPNGKEIGTLEELPGKVWHGVLPIEGEFGYVSDLINRLQEHFGASPEEGFEEVKDKHRTICQLCGVNIVIAGVPILDAYRAGEHFKKSMWLMTIQRVNVPEVSRFTSDLALAFLVSPGTDYTEGGKPFFLQRAAVVYARCADRLQRYFTKRDDEREGSGHQILIDGKINTWWNDKRIQELRDDLWLSLEEIIGYTHLNLKEFQDYLDADIMRLLRCAKSFRRKSLWLPLLTKGSAEVFVRGFENSPTLLQRVNRVTPGTVLSGFWTLNDALKSGKHPEGTTIEHEATIKDGEFQITLLIKNCSTPKELALDILGMPADSPSSLRNSLKELYDGGANIFPTWRGRVVTVLIKLAVGDDIGG